MTHRYARSLRIALVAFGLVQFSARSGQAQAAPPLPPPRVEGRCTFTTVGYDGNGYPLEEWTPPIYTVETYDQVFSPDVHAPFAWEAITAGYNVQANWWDDGWGAKERGHNGSRTRASSPAGKLLAALALLNEPPAENYNGVVNWAKEFVQAESFKFVPSCEDTSRAYTTIWRINLRNPWFEDDVFVRAGTLVHETRHAQGHQHDDKGNQCEAGEAPPGCCRDTDRSCDKHFDDWGANSVGIAYLASLARSESMKESPRLDAGAQSDAIAEANNLLRGRFSYPPSFRYTDVLASPDFGLLDAGSDDEYPGFWTSVDQGGQTSEPTWMTEEVGHFCFLTYVTGKFEDTKQFVRVERAWDSSSKFRWRLSGGTNRTDRGEAIGAAARCLELDGGPPVAMHRFTLDDDDGSDIQLFPLGEPADTRSCFLTGIGGALRDSEDGALLLQVDGQWVARLKGQSDDDKRLSAQFGCIDAVSLALVSQETPGNVGDYSKAEAALACAGWDTVPEAAEADNAYCALAGIKGQFDGGDERVEILPHSVVLGNDDDRPPPTFDDDPQGEELWSLRVTERRVFNSVTGYASCFLRPRFSGATSRACLISGGWPRP